MKFTGHERDLNNPDGTGDDLDYMHARYCSPLTARFLSVDPANSANPANPQKWNRYAYSLNNPLKFLDPNGRETQLVYGTNTAGNVFGHVSIAINDEVFSFNTKYASPTGDWGVPLDLFLENQSDKRASTLITLDITGDQETALRDFLASNRPNRNQYDEISNSCVTICENALDKTNILSNEPGPPVIDYAGNELQAGAPRAFTPTGLVQQLRDQGLVAGESEVGEEQVSKWRSLKNTLRVAFERIFGE